MIFFSEIVDVGGKTLETAEGVWGTILKSLRSAFFGVNELIYKMCALFYNIFDKLCGARLLENEEIIKIATKIGFILGIVMVLKVIFDFVQLLLEPDNMNDKQKGVGAIIKKLLFVIVMLGTINFMFNSLYYLQNVIIKNKIIYKVLLPADDVEIDTDNFGNVLAARSFASFYTVNQVILEQNIEEAIQCEDYRNLLMNEIVENSDYSAGALCLNAYSTDVVKNEENESADVEAFIMDYNYILQTIVGIIMVYILFSYVFKVGIRVIQLSVLEIISPVAIIGYLSPKSDNMLSKWWKLYFSTYIDVFVRMAIIYFVVYLSADILDKMNTGTSIFWESVGNPNGTERMFISVAMILALLTFAKKAPDLIKELLPASANKLGFGPSIKDIVGLERGIGMIGGAATGAAIGLVGGVAGGNKIGNRITGALGGIFGGTVRGGVTGLKSKGISDAMKTSASTQSKANLRRAQNIASGATFAGSVSRWFNEGFGMISKYEKLDNEVSSLNELKSDIEKEDAVKYAQSAHDTAYNEYVKLAGGNALSIKDWEDSTNDGKLFKKKLEEAKDKTYKDLYLQNGAFAEKVHMHNKRFGTRFNESSKWNDEKNAQGQVTARGINSIRKEKGNKLEKIRAQKPRK